MQKSRREAIDELLDFAGELNDSGARDTAERLLNRALETIWLKHPWSQFISPAPLQITLVANQRSYALPDHFGRVRSPRSNPVRNLTRGTSLRLLDDSVLFDQYPESGTTLEVASDPSCCSIFGTVGASTQPAAAGDALEVVSSSAADTTVRVAIAGDDTSGRNTRAQVTLNGVTPVAIGTWTFVDEFGKSYPAGSDPTTELTSSAGTVTLRKTAGGTVLQTLFPEESARRHQVFLVYPKPTAADVLAVPFIRSINRLYNDADNVPSAWGPALFEEMMIQWQVGTGDLPMAQAGRVTRAAFMDLVMFDNENRPRIERQPFNA